MGDWRNHLDTWSDDLPSQVRSKSNHKAIASLGDELMSLRIEFNDAQKACTRVDERLENAMPRLKRVEETLITGTHNLVTRVSVLENQDKNFLREIEELHELRDLAKFVTSFPLGIKGFLLSLIIVIISVTFITDLAVRVYVIDEVKAKIIQHLQKK